MNTTNIDQIIDVYDIWYQPWWHSKPFYAFVVLFALFVLVTLLYFIWTRYMRAHAFSFEQVALLNLQELHKRSYKVDHDMRDAYFKLTMIMKVYLSKQYKIALLNKTDQELISHIQELVPVEISATLQELFERAYQIKFASAAVSEKMLYDDIDFMQKVIYQTIKQGNNSGDS